MAAQEATDVRRILAHVENNAMPLRDGKLSQIWWRGVQRLSHHTAGLHRILSRRGLGSYFV